MPQQWKPISSAPKDGSRVLIWHPDYCAPITAQWYGNEGWKMDSDVSPFWRQPTHWMPLPAAPGTPPASAQDDAKEWGPAFDEWFVKSGVWPTYEEIFAAGWNARSVDALAAGDALNRLVAEKFTSGNAIAVERITITRAEYDAAIASQQQEG
jgi:hypothetical protein